MSATITDFITADLKERICSQRPLPANLTLGDLAVHYGVSLTPVRLAVSTLLDEKLLLKTSNGRLSINPAREASRFMSEPRRLARADWETPLVQEIIAKSLQGYTDYLREEAMAQRYEIGRTILRQCFSRLAGKGLLEHVPRCGWRVRTYDEKDMQDYLVVREAMELTALDLARPRLVAADLERMLQGNAEASPGAPARLDNQLHSYFIGKAENAYIEDFFDRHGLYYTFLFDFAAPEAHVMSEMADQHRTILKALLDNEETRAREALAHHIRAQFPIVKQLMEKLAEEYTP